MADVQIPEGAEIVQMGNALVYGYDVAKTTVKGTEGEDRAVVVLSMEFQAARDMVVRQSFVIPAGLARLIRTDLKNPRPIKADEATDSNEETHP